MGEMHKLCAFGWVAHSRNSRLRIFTKDTQIFYGSPSLLILAIKRSISLRLKYPHCSLNSRCELYALMRYGGGLPWHREAGLQAMGGMQLGEATMWSAARRRRTPRWESSWG
jgi:hypothetical protein